VTSLAALAASLPPFLSAFPRTLFFFALFGCHLQVFVFAGQHGEEEAEKRVQPKLFVRFRSSFSRFFVVAILFKLQV